MLSIQDVIDYCDLDKCEIEAIAEHEHIPLTVAAELSDSLLCTPEGVCQVHAMLVENMQRAIEAGNYEHVRDLYQTYQHLQRTHPVPTH